MRFPPILQDNPCFESPEQMRELLGDISNAMTDRQSDDDSNEFPEDTDDIFEKLSVSQLSFKYILRSLRPVLFIHLFIHSFIHLLNYLLTYFFFIFFFLNMF